MDGYSVQEAASVLGVAEGRVWELLARGVLLGTPEGDSMRVFLKGQAGPIASSTARDEPPRTNGNGGSHGAAGEESPFRELLTEFRNLTERYGQALLALGESRGEVAGLRSRVDLLEARLDLRLPPTIDAAPVAWESATIPAAAPEAQPKSRSRKQRTSRDAVAGFADALARAQDPSAAELRRSRVEDSAAAESTAEDIAAAFSVEAPDEVAAEAAPRERPVVEVSAEEPVADTADETRADAIAEEPVTEAIAEEPVTEAIAEEPVAESIAESPTAEEIAAEPIAAEPIAAEPAAEPAAEVVAEEPVTEAAAEEPAPASPAEPEPPTYSAVVVEPDWFADGDFAWLEAADREPSTPGATEGGAVAGPEAVTSKPEPAADEPEVAAPEPEPATAASADHAEMLSEVATGEPSDQPPEQLLAQEPEPVPEPLASEPAPEPEPAPGFEAEAEFESWQPPEAPITSPGAGAPAAADIDEAPERQTMSAAVAVEELEEEVMWLGASPTPVVQDEPMPQPWAESTPWPVVDIASQATDVVRPPLAMTEDELARLAMDEGWDDAEVAAIRAIITPVPSAQVDLPGAAELHEAMAALEAVPVRADPRYDASRQWAKPAPEDTVPPHHDDWAFEAEPAPPQAAPPTVPPRTPTDVTSALRRSVARRQGPAAAAYRRLRRLFPG